MNPLLLALALGLGQEPPKPALAWAVPPGWRTETLAFPLDFAPTVVHKGREEIRFCPGFFKPEAPDFWSYAFAWRLEEPTAPGIRQLERELTAYFKGLCLSVAQGKYALDASRFQARLEAGGGGWIGRVETYDPFRTGKPVTLRVRVLVRTCAEGRALVFALSPQPEEAPIWRELAALQDAFPCP